ncbi:MAG: tRNA (guanosine(46)-N7)-methyltransferase TrmB [Desulfobacter sp.]|nr:tRNA (guanosine(46)-N7)-methyltransferase TrmB [Desulfobacter sp.]WDP87794.1 MAG: tRNA (guanosine(46)-N7)-methyltransferase TrmB [Desulfobacter sp.]
MPKTKNRKYERVRHLANVILPASGETRGPWPWQQPPYSEMDTILELGCGKGEHSLGFAAAFPQKLCVGVDQKSYRLCDGGEAGLARGFDNLLFLRANIRNLHLFFKDHSIAEIWLTFPDPHPKQREIKHRLTSSDFMAAYARLLVPGGMVHLKTDSDLLFTYTREMVEYWGGDIKAVSIDFHQSKILDQGAGHIVSTFEAKAVNQGKTIKYLGFTLTTDSGENK